jgi:hypothetical protein
VLQKVLTFCLLCFDGFFYEQSVLKGFNFQHLLFAGYFKERILFLTVSQSPNVEQLRAKIWGHIMGNGSFNTNYVVPQWKLQYECSGSQPQILVILDDVWSPSVLEQLVFRMPNCKFIVVSRFIFPIFNATYKVELLGEDDALSLFCHHAFGQKSIPFAANQNLVKQVMVSSLKL